VNRRITQLAFGLMGCFVLLFVAMNYWQVGRQSELNADSANTRAIRREFGSARGQIITYDGEVVAESVAAPEGSAFPYQRVYPHGEMFAGITGYYSFPFGATQIERTMDDVLRGATGRQRLSNLQDIVTNGDGTGSVRLTIDYDLQALAKQLLDEGGFYGSIVVLDTRTGAVRAMYSNPTYDPNDIASLDFDAASDALLALQDAPGNPLLNNAYQDRFAPGSTFKLVTTSVALDDGAITMNNEWPVESAWLPPQTSDPIENYHGSECGGDLLYVFTKSCNIPFARIAVENLGIGRFVNGAARWGIGERIPFDLPRSAASTIGDYSDWDQNLPFLAMSGFGAYEVQMVPLHTALIASTIANGGVMYEPYVVDASLDSRGNALDVTTGHQTWLTPISPDTAVEMNTLMQSVAVNGTASCCIGLRNGISVAAKTGTAQLPRTEDGRERSNVWITAFAPADQPRFAVAVVILGTNDYVSESTGGRLAGPIAREMLNAALADEDLN